MTTTVRTTAALLLVACAVVMAQARASASWTLAAVAVSGTAESRAHEHTLAAVPGGSPTSCTVKLEGSLDGAAWFDLTGDQTCTSAVMVHVDAKPVNYVRANLTALAGGTNPSVAIKYLGVQ